MLVTNLHVMAEGDDDNYRNPAGDEMMFQGGGKWSDKVGGKLVWEPITFKKPNVVDIAMCELDDRVNADFKR